MNTTSTCVFTCISEYSICMRYAYDGFSMAACTDNKNICEESCQGIS